MMLDVMINEMMNTNKPIHAFCAYTGKYERSFNSYEEFHSVWPAAEICNVEIDDEACFVYC